MRKNGSGTASQFGAAYATTDYAKVLEDPDVDLVVIATRHDRHAAMALEALRHGKHVLVEKPLATSLDEARELVELGRTSPGLLVCAPHIVISPTYRQMHARVGAVGADQLEARDGCCCLLHWFA